MQNSKFIALFQQLDASETKKFLEFIQSPFFNKNQKITQLADLVHCYAPDFQHPALSKEKLYQSIWGNSKVEISKINNLISDLLQLLYAFLAQQSYSKEPSLKYHLLNKNLLQRDAAYHLERNLQKSKQLQDKQNLRNYAHFNAQYQLYEQFDKNYLSKSKRAFDDNLQKESDSFDIYYWTKKLMIACEMANRNSVMQANYDYSITNQLEVIFEQFPRIKKEPCINVYYQTLQMILNSSNESYYQEIKNLLKENLDLFPQDELSNLYGYLLNFCIKRINSGQTFYYQEIFELHKLLLEQNIIFENEYLSDRNFRNIVTAGLRLKDFQWTEQFIHQYKDRLRPEIRENAALYNLASFYYERKDYKRALQQLYNVEFTDSSYHVGAKIIQVKSYYELNEYEAFLSLFEAFKKYLQRNKELSDYQKNTNLAFLKFSKKIFQLKNSKSLISKAAWKKKYNLVNEQLATPQSLANKEWLKEVVIELIKDK